MRKKLARLKTWIIGVVAVGASVLFLLAAGHIAGPNSTKLQTMSSESTALVQANVAVPLQPSSLVPTLTPTPTLTSTPAATSAPVYTVAETQQASSTGKSMTLDLSKTVPATNVSTAIAIHDPFFAYAFTWDSGSFTYSFDGKNYNAPDLQDGDIPDTGIKGLATDLDFDHANAPVIYIKNASAAGLKLQLIQPDTQPATMNVAGYVTTPQYTGAILTKLPIVSRAAWGADESKALWLPSYEEIKRVIVHHTAGSNSSPNYAAVVRSIFQYHAVTLDWGDIGYNYLIDPNGVIYEGRKGGDGVIAAHTYQHNTGSVGIAFIGNYNSVMPSDAAIISLKHLIGEKSAIYNLPMQWQTTFFGHRDFNPTDCPGNTLYSNLPGMIPDINDHIAFNLTDVTAAVTKANAAFTVLGHDQKEVYGDLLVTFNEPADVSESVMRGLIPPFSGIQTISIMGNKAHLRLIRYSGSGGSLRTFRAKYLYAYFSMRSDVSNIDIVSDYLTTN